MPNEPQRPQRPGWKSAGKQPGPRPKHAWQGGTAKGSAEPVHHGISRRGKLGIVGAGFALLAAGIVILILFLRPPKPSNFELVYVPHEDDIASPLSAWSKQAKQYSSQVKNEKLKYQENQLSVDDEPWAGIIERSTGTIHEKAPDSVVIFLAVPGGADGDGPYLIPNGAGPIDRTRFLRIDVLLKKLRDLPAGTKKLVVFDAVQSPSFWPLGLIQNDFAKQLKKTDFGSVKNLVVICSAEEGQRSWVSEEWGQSAFAHYFLAALRGNATERPSAAQIFQQVKRDVGEWVYNNWGVAQELFILGDLAAADKMEFAGQGGSNASQAPAAPPALDVVVDAWKKRDELALISPPPWATAPLLWRQYLDWLIRYENLVRIGGDTTTAQSKLSTLANQIDGARPDLKSLYAVLPASTALASRPVRRLHESGDAAEPSVEKDVVAGLADNATDAAKNKVPELAADKQNPTRWPAVLNILLTQAIADPAKLNRACEFARAILGDDPPPSEILLMLELHRFQDKSKNRPESALISTALSVRKQAEEAALGLTGGNPASESLPAYSEQILPWIKDDVEVGDKLRRVAEDHLFSEKKADWSNATGLLKQAEASYRKAQEKALQIRIALAARDDLLTALPYYAQWQAESRKPDTSIIGVIVDLCGQAHELDRLLADPKRATPATALQERAVKAQGGFNDLKNKFHKECESLATNGGQQEPRHAIEAALHVPLIDSKLRADLLDNLRAIRGRIKEKPETERRLDDAKKEEEKYAASRALRETQLALAVFGLDKGAENDPAAAGRAVHDHWLKQLQAVQESMDKGSGAVELAAARDAFVQAGSGAQRLDGAAASYLTGTKTPSETRFSVQLHDLLTWQAERTYQDHWFSNDGAVAYYCRIGQDYVKDAEDRIRSLPAVASGPETEQRLAVANNWKAKFEKPVKLEGFWQDEKLGLKVLRLTDESAMPREFKITVPEPLAEGAIAYRFERGAGLLPRSEDWSLHPIQAGKREFVGEDRFSVEKKPQQQLRLKPDTSNHGLRAYFRGQSLHLNTDVQIYRKPDIVAAGRRMPPGRIAVQAEQSNYDAFRARNTAIAFVLDASGSMNFAPNGIDTGTKAGRNRRFDRALDALKTVLEKLPAGMYVSLRIFSQEEYGGKDKVIWPSAPWNADREVIRDRVEQLRTLTPKGQTPLIDNMEAAKADFHPSCTGKKLMIVLTDGGDDREPDMIPGAVSAAFSDLPKDRDGNPTLQIRVIGFEVKDERDRIRNVKFKEALKHVGGEYYDVKDQKQLATILRDAVGGLTYLVEDTNTGKVIETDEVSPNIGEYKWTNKPLHPDLYALLLRVKGDNQYLRQRVRLDPGDVLALNLIPQDDAFTFQRDIYAKSYFDKRLGAKPTYFFDGDRKTWEGAVYQNQQTSRLTLRMMTTLERLEPPRLGQGQEGTLFQPKPAYIWHEVKPEGVEDRLALTYQPLPGYPAPAWEFAVEDWPKDKPPTLDVWWLDRSDASYAPNAFEQTIRAGVHFTVGKLVQKLEPEYAHGKELLFMDSLGIESMSFGGPPEDCLVARFRFEPNKRFMVRMLNPVTSEEQEHRFYTDAGKYVAVFRGWTKQKLLENEKSLNFDLIYVNALKKAVESTTHATVKLGKPDDKPRPQPPATATESQ
jgi:Mg-chelatase subunit ChlD